MKKLIFLLTISTIFYVPDLLSQYPHGNHQFNDNCNSILLRGNYEYLEVDGMLYTADYQGIKMLMSNYRQNNPEMYSTLLKDYRRIEQKRNAALTLFVVSSVSGTAMIIGGSTILGHESSNEFFRENNIKETNFLLMGAGIAAFFGGSICSLAIAPGRNDLYSFINAHNRNADQKLNWHLGMKTTPGAVGLVLAAKF